MPRFELFTFRDSKIRSLPYEAEVWAFAGWGARYGGGMTWRTIWLVLLAGATVAGAAEARIMKVLPHWLDRAGRHSLSPSLFERDAYQGQLRMNREEVSALRFDVQWRGRGEGTEPLKLRLELRGSGTDLQQPRVYEVEVKAPRFFSRWTKVRLEKAEVESLGEVQAWRASLRQGDQEIAELQSFLW